jgi:large subunit ribosomal protein L21
MATTYAIISLGGKQYRVREGERLLVDRLKTDEGKTFQPDILFLGGDGDGQLSPSNVAVTAKVVGHVLGEKVRIGKYRPKSGYKRHTGFRARLSQIEIESIGAGSKRATAAPKAEPKAEPKAAEPKAEPKQQETPAPTPKTATAAHPVRDYDDLTVAEVADRSKRWRLEQLQATLEHERKNANRKGAIAALETAIAAKQEKGS